MIDNPKPPKPERYNPGGVIYSKPMGIFMGSVGILMKLRGIEHLAHYDPYRNLSIGFIVFMMLLGLGLIIIGIYEATK